MSAALDPPFPGARVEMAEFEPYDVPRSYKDVVDVPAHLRAHLPSSFDIVGDLVVLKVPAALQDHGPAIGAAILRAHPNLRGVFHDAGVEGERRVRRLEHLAGERRTTTTHAEYGAKLKLDLSTAYFSPRLANEHQRVASAIKPGEHFVDATAGVGPFTVLAGRRGAAGRITAIDVNPQALALLRENLALNRVSTRVDVVEADATTAFRKLDPFQRVAINLPHGGESILEAAWKAIQPGGTIHYYTMAAQHGVAPAAEAIVTGLRARTGLGGMVDSTRIVHPYSPQDAMVGVDLRRDPA